MTAKSVVYICAHPDDIISVAGTLTLLRQQGFCLYDMCLTPGQRGYQPENAAAAGALNPPRMDVAARRTSEEQAACALLGAELIMFDEMDGELYAHRAICGQVAARLGAIKPTVVITLWALEKPDHAAAFSIAHKALHLAGLSWTTELYMAAADPHGYNFQPNLYVNITRVIEQKKAVALAYTSQLGARAGEFAVERARACGRPAWCDYAEAFATSVPLMGTRWDRPAEVGRTLLQL